MTEELRGRRRDRRRRARRARCGPRGSPPPGGRPLVVEARDRVGGRMLNEEIGDGKVVEVGGQWIGPSQERIAALAAELGVDTFPTYDERSPPDRDRGQLGLLRGRDHRRPARAWSATSPGRSRRWPWSTSNRPGPGSTGWRGRCRLSEPWAAAKALATGTARPSPPGSAATRARAAARTLFELATEAVWAAEPTDVSLLHVLFYTRSGSGFNTLLGTGGGAQQDRFHGGSQRIALLMAEQLGEERLRLAAPVRRIEHGAGGVILASRRGGRRAGRAATCAPAARSSLSRRPWPGGSPTTRRCRRRRDQLTQRMPQGTVIKTMAIYEQPLLARGRPLGPGGQRRRPGPRRLRQLAARRQPRRPARLPRGTARPRVGRAARRRAARARSSPATRASSASGRRGRSASSSASGRRRSGRAAATAA